MLMTDCHWKDHYLELARQNLIVVHEKYDPASYIN